MIFTPLNEMVVSTQRRGGAELPTKSMPAHGDFFASRRPGTETWPLIVLLISYPPV